MSRARLRRRLCQGARDSDPYPNTADGKGSGGKTGNGFSKTTMSSVLSGTSVEKPPALVGHRGQTLAGRKRCARAIDFYERLGFAKAFENGRGCTMTAGETKLFVFKTRQVNPPLVQRELGLFQNPPGLDHISFLVADVDQAYANLKTRGVTFEVEPADQDWGARVAVLKDPNGNNLYLLAWIRRE
jgi:catechol 2,3-dioxygenase-like lactoylglutathione lyase family enzyme